MKKAKFIPLTRPTLPKVEKLVGRLKEVFESGMITNYKYVKLFEEQCAKYLGVKYAVAVSCGTSALLITLKCLDIKGEVILPSFTYTSGGHTLLHSGIKPVFADINPETCNLDPSDAAKKITKKTSAIMPTHVFGNPCDISAIEKLARTHNLKVIYDAAHAFGSKYRGKSVACFGDAVIYSFTPTKVFTTAEGGLIATNNKKLAEKLQLARLNGDSFNREEEFLGHTARMGEFEAILGLETLKNFEKTLKRRLEMVELFKRSVKNIKGITYQKVEKNCRSAYKDFTVLVNEKKAGFTRDELMRELKKNNIQTKVYFDPPLHKKKVYRAYKDLKLPHTDYLSTHIVNLPLYSHMPKKEVKRISDVILHLSTNDTTS